MFRHGQLANIVKHRSGPQRFGFVFRQTQFPREFHGINANALQVLSRGLILGLDGQGESLDGSQMKIGNFLRVLLFRLQFPR